MAKVKLTDICKPKQWKTIPMDELLPNGFPVYGANGIIGYYNEFNHENSVICITCRGATCGRVNMTAPKSYVTGNAMCLDDLRSDIDLEYLYYCLLHYDFTNVISGSAQPQITRQGLEKVVLIIGTPVEQKNVVKILKQAQSVIQNREKELQALDELIKSRFVEMFGDPETNPNGYPVRSMADIATYWNGLTYKPEDVSEEGTIVLRSSNIQNMQLDFADTVRVSCKIGDKKYVQENDILMCSRNGSAKLVGKVALIKGIKEPMSFGAFMMIIRSDYYPYLMTYFQMPAFRSQIVTGATTTINQITGSMMDKVLVPVPDKITIDNYATFVAQINKSKFAVQKALDEAQLLFDSLMQKYFG